MYKQSFRRLTSKGLVIEKQVKNNANKIDVSLSSWRHLWSMQSHTKSFARIESDWTLRLVLQFWFMRFTTIRSHLNFYVKSNYAIDHAPCPRRTVFWEWPVWHILVSYSRKFSCCPFFPFSHASLIGGIQDNLNVP